jgi:hypothetical protein
VSITQSFNTTSSMGRLTLNVLLSFAQFERALRCVTGGGMEKRQITRQELVAGALELGARPGTIRQWFHRGIPYRWQIRLIIDETSASTKILPRFLTAIGRRRPSRLGCGSAASRGRQT